MPESIKVKGARLILISTSFDLEPFTDNCQFLFHITFIPLSYDKRTILKDLH